MSKYYKNRKKKIYRYLRNTRIKRAISSRVISTIVTTTICWLVTGDPFIGLSVGAFDTLIKLVIYYVHEGWWERKMSKDIREIKDKFKRKEK